jgi:hypothetical protein
MGYDFHITRKDHWADEEGLRISLDEWREYARADSNLSLDPDNPRPENWIVAEHGRAWPLWWDETGEIVAKNPDPPMIEKLVAIANALGAHALGDDGEVYGETSIVG